jgi:hypothetical protein
MQLICNFLGNFFILLIFYLLIIIDFEAFLVTEKV